MIIISAMVKVRVHWNKHSYTHSFLVIKCSVAWYLNISTFAEDGIHDYCRVLHWLSYHQVNSSIANKIRCLRWKTQWLWSQFHLHTSVQKRHQEFHIWQISLFNLCHMYKFLLFVIYLLSDCKIWICHKMEISYQKWSNILICNIMCFKSMRFCVEM